MIRFAERLHLMISSRRRQEIGQLIRNKRKYLGLDQIGLAIKIWGKKLSDGALQSKISRIERGESWADYSLVFEVIDALDLWDEVLETSPAGQVIEKSADCIDVEKMITSFEQFIPNLNEVLKILYNHARRGQADLFYRQLALLCDAAQSLNTSRSGNF